jgi:hypothetical protein
MENVEKGNEGRNIYVHIAKQSFRCLIISRYTPNYSGIVISPGETGRT